MSYCEELCEKSLKLIFQDGIKIIRNYRPDWLKNPETGRNLEIDFYLPHIGFALEIQGEHHYFDENQKQRDNLKRELILKKGLVLIELSIIQISPTIIYRRIMSSLHYYGMYGWLKDFDKSWIDIQEFKDYRNSMKKFGKKSLCIKSPYSNKHGNIIRKENLKIKKMIFDKKYVLHKKDNYILKLLPLEIIGKRVKCLIVGTKKIIFIGRRSFYNTLDFYLKKRENKDNENRQVSIM